MIRKTLITTIIAIAITTMVSGQETWNLERCMLYALENTPDIKKKIAENDNLSVEYRDAIMDFLPEIEGGIGANVNFGRSIDPETNTYINYSNFNNSYSISTGYTIFNGFNTVNNYKIAKNAKLMGVSEAQIIEDEICLAVIQAYYNVLYYQEMSALAQQQKEEADRNLYLTKRQEEQGVKGYAEVADMEAAFAEKDYNLTKMQNSYANAISVLKEKMSYPYSDTLIVEKEITLRAVKEDYIDTYDIIARAELTLPSLIKARGDIENARLRLRTSRWQILPSLSAYAGYSTGYATVFDNSYTTTPFLEQLEQRQGEYIQLQLSIPIFYGLNRHSNIRKNKNALHIAEYDYEKNRKEMEINVEIAVQDMQNALKSLIYADKRVKAQQKAHNLNIRRYEQGLISAIEYQTSSNNIMSAEAEYLNALLQYNLKSRIVDYYKGISYINQEN